MPYSLEEFIQDVRAMREIDTPEWEMGSDLRRDHTGRVEYPPHLKPFIRQINYFHHRYGKVSGGDNGFRFMIIVTFLQRYRAELIEKGVIGSSTEETDAIPAGFVRLLLDGFIDPQPPAKYATHRDFNTRGELSFKKVMQRYNFH